MKSEVGSLKGERKSDLPERSFGFARRIVLLCRVLDEKPGVRRTLANQLLRSGTSVGAKKKDEFRNVKSEKFQTSNFPLQISNLEIQR